MINTFIKKHLLTLLGILIGAIGGYLYWYFIGCSSGNCPITSSPVNSSIWGGIFGGIFLSLFEKKTPKNTKNEPFK